MKIEIEDFTFTCIIGVLDFERVDKQRVIVNITIEYNYIKDNFINYADVANIAKETIKTKKFELLEDALISVKEAIIKEFDNIEKLYIKISKPDILDNCIVSLSNNWKF